MGKLEEKLPASQPSVAEPVKDDECCIELGLHVGDGIVEDANAVARVLVQDSGHCQGCRALFSSEVLGNYTHIWDGVDQHIGGKVSRLSRDACCI